MAVAGTPAVVLGANRVGLLPETGSDHRQFALNAAAQRPKPKRTTYRAISTDSAGGAISVWATVQ